MKGYKYYICNNCRSRNKIPKLIVLLKYVLFGKTRQYYNCYQCGHTHSFFIYSNIVKDNADTNLKKKNENKTKTEWKNP